MKMSNKLKEIFNYYTLDERKKYLLFYMFALDTITEKYQNNERFLAYLAVISTAIIKEMLEQNDIDFSLKIIDDYELVRKSNTVDLLLGNLSYEDILKLGKERLDEHRVQNVISES
jgi:hypothetical protein